MATDSPYLPDLARCLSGEVLLCSWDDILNSLLSHDATTASHPPDFFADKSVQALLSKPIPSFPPPSSQSKSAFETKTAAINVPQSRSKQYDIDKIKADALWLSKEMQIDELEALRMTIAEWQYQPETRLKSGFSDAELASLRDALGSDYVQSRGLTPSGPFSRSDDAFDTADHSHKRLLQTCFAEQTRLLSTASEILQQAHLLSIEQSEPGDQWKSVLKNVRPRFDKPLQEFVQSTLQSLEHRIEALDRDAAWPVSDDCQSQVVQDFMTTSLQSIAVILEMLLVRVKNVEEPATGDTVLTWLQFMDRVDYFTRFESEIPGQARAIERIHAATSCISISLLDPSQTLASVLEHTDLEAMSMADNPKQDWFLDRTNIGDIHRSLVDAAERFNPHASLSVVVWAMLLHEIRIIGKRSKEANESRVAEWEKDRDPNDASLFRTAPGEPTLWQGNIYEQIYDEVMMTNRVGDPVDYMSNCAIEGANVYEEFARICSTAKDSTSIVALLELEILQDWVGSLRPSLGYTPGLVSAQELLLTPPPRPGDALSVFDAVANFVQSDTLKDAFFDTAERRFPYESLPFLRLCRLVAPFSETDSDGTNYVAFRLRGLQNFTQAAIEGFGSYSTYREDENANYVILENAVSMLDFAQDYLLTSGDHVQYHALLPAQTVGTVVKNASPIVVRWDHSYCGLALLGKWLEMHLQARLNLALSPFEDPSEVAAEVVGLLAALLQNTYINAKSKVGQNAAQQLCSNLLDDTSRDLTEDLNIVVCISDLMEQQLQTPGRGHELLVSCIKFFTTLSRIQPQLSWSSLMRSSIFGAKGTRQNLPSAIASIEIPSQRFDLLENCSELLEAVVESSLIISFQSDDQLQSAKDLKAGRRTIAQRFHAAALLTYSETMYAAFESMHAWIFNDRLQKERITANLASAFSCLVYNAFGAGEGIGTTTSLSASLQPAASFVVRMLQEVDATATGTGPVMPVLVSLITDNGLRDGTTPAPLHTRQILSLCSILVRYCRLASDNKSLITAALFNMMPICIRLPFLDARLRNDCYDLMTSLLSGPSSSLLGHLGSASSISFVDVIKHSISSVPNDPTKIRIWTLLSRLITMDQQWLAIVLITGGPPSRLQSKIESLPKTRGKPIVEAALEELTAIDSLPPSVSVAILKFLCEAQQNWLLVTDSIILRTNFYPGLIKYITSMEPSRSSSSDRASHNKVAAGVTDLAVIHLHRLMALKNEKVFTTFMPLLSWLANNAIEVASYNTSLQANLKKNFAMKYRDMDVGSIKRSGLLEVSYGPNYFYDTMLASKFLANDAFWKGTGRQQGFESEFHRANTNLSVVDSEVYLLRSLERLCIEHAKFFSRNRDVARIMAQIVRNCLDANMQVTPAEAIFDTLFQTRAELAIVLIRPLASATYTGSDFSALLTASWYATRFRNGSYEIAIANDDLVYWRTMLNVLSMSMSFRVDRKPKQTHVLDDKSMEKIDPFNTTYTEVASKIVGEGLRSVVLALQDQHQASTRGASTTASQTCAVGVKDVVILLNILQTILRMPSLPQFTNQLSDALISSGVGQSALLLYSWSHTLLVENQPVYAELAARFLSSISSLPRVAEDLAVEGVLNRLLTARITQSIQAVPNGISHLDRRPFGPLLYSVWSQGLLPLCLNLLHAIGGGVAAEVSGFLDAFPNQISRASLAMTSNPAYADEGAGKVTGKLVGEVSSLGVMSFILSTFRDAGASAGVDPDMVMELTGFDESRKSLAEDVRDFVSMEYASRRKKTIAETARERQLQNTIQQDGKGGKVTGDRLDDALVRELNGAMAALLGGDDTGGQSDEEGEPAGRDSVSREPVGRGSFGGRGSSVGR